LFKQNTDTLRLKKKGKRYFKQESRFVPKKYKDFFQAKGKDRKQEQD